jgi:hypothetical protein
MLTPLLLADAELDLAVMVCTRLDLPLPPVSTCTPMPMSSLIDDGYRMCWVVTLVM